MQATNPCVDCANFTEPNKCKAYPKLIPSDIWIGWVDHTKPFKGDNGIRFEAIDDTDKS